MKQSFSIHPLTRQGKLRARLLLTLLLCLLLAVTTGCFKQQLSSGKGGRPVTPGAPGAPSGRTPGPASETSSAQTVIQTAENALRAGDVALAEQLSTGLSSRPGLSAEDAPRVWRVLALSSLENKHPYLSVTALERWRQSQAGVDDGAEWQSAWGKALHQLPAYDARNRAQAIVTDTARPWALRNDMLLFLLAPTWEKDATGGNLQSLAAFYAGAVNKEQRMLSEQRFFELLGQLETPVLQKLEVSVTESTQKNFPYILVTLDSLRRQAQEPAQAEAAAQAVNALKDGHHLAWAMVFDHWQSAPATTTARADTGPIASLPPISGRAVVLAVPRSGQLGSFGNRIALGAQVAIKAFTDAGHAVTLVVIDTENPQWLEQLASLPASATVVGGPMRAKDYTAAKEKGLTDSRAFMTFMTGLPDAQMQDEGRVAWRFFSSPDDQMAALFRLTRELDVTELAILMPDDKYAEHMAELFTTKARQSGASVTRRSVYSNKPAEWNKHVAAFLQTNKNNKAKPQVPFKAVFMPDSWKNTEILVPNLFYFNEMRQLLLGTSLWEPALAAQTHGDARYYGLAAFPAAWDMTLSSPAAQSLQAGITSAGEGTADFWAGLGYDFARFAATLDLQPGWTPESMNSLLSGHQGMAWSTAPITWAYTGKASQELQLFTPANQGYVPVSLEQFKDLFTKAWQ